MSNYAVNEEGNNLQVCVVTLPGPTFADNANNINLEIDVATAGDTATGKYSIYFYPFLLYN